MSDLVADSVIDGKYRIVRPLGEGGMGTVYLADHLFLRKPVALKVLRPELTTNTEVGARFLREARAASTIDDPHVVRVIDFGSTSSGQLYLVMELLEGRSLADEMAGAARVETDRARFIAIGILRGLEAAHAHEVIHRDLKPENVFLARRNGDEIVKLVDFGIARVREEGGTRLTSTGAVLGTPLYMAPEQVRGQEIDVRVDLHALGVILYEMIAGRPPYQGATFGAISHEILSGSPAPLQSLAPHVPPPLAAIVMRALAPSRTDRFATATEMRTAIEAVPQSLAADPWQHEQVRASRLTDLPRTTGPSSDRPPTLPTVGRPATFSAPSRTDLHLEPDAPNLELDRPEPPAPPAAEPASRSPAGPLIIAAIALVAIAAAAWLALAHRAPPLPATVHIAIVDLPPGARVFLDNTPTEPNFELPGSRAPRRLRIEARGYATRLELVTPDADQTLDGHLTKTR